MEEKLVKATLIRCVSALLAAAASVAAMATERGGTVYALGAGNFAAGALPPPGFYGMLIAGRYTADRLNDAAGDDLNVPGFKVAADAIAPRFIWVTGAKLLDNDVTWHVITPIVDVNVSAAGQAQHKAGLGDIVAGPGLGMHHSAHLHSIIGVDFYLPTGRYESNDLANVGRNYYAVELLYILSHIDPNGFNGDIDVRYLFNGRNKDTHYKSGHEFHFDYAVGWGFGNQWTAGIGGYYWQQTTPDEQDGSRMPNSKGRGFAIGPSVKFDSGKGWFATLKWQKEVVAENRPQGNAVWFRAVFPL